MEEIKISVVVPFYNAKDYVTQAVESALQQPETGEVLLIEDGSPDGGLEVCQSLADQYPQVKLLRHKDGKNHGAAASRNLGVHYAVFPYIAFLDADDFYLPNRFSRTIEVFTSYDEVDGVYEAIGATFQNEAVKEFWSHLPLKELTTVNKLVEPELLFEGLMKAEIGYFHFNGLTVRKSLFKKTGYFQKDLEPHEDTDLMFKLCAKGRLFPGNIKIPVAIRRVHELNRITYHFADKRKTYSTNILLWRSFLMWGKSNLTHRKQQLALHRYITHLRKSDTFSDFSWKDFLRSRINMFMLAREFPYVLVKKYFWRLLIPSREIFQNLTTNLTRLDRD